MSDPKRDESSNRRLRRAAMMAGVAALVVPAGLAMMMDWSALFPGRKLAAAMHVGGLVVAILLLALLLHLLAAFGGGKNFRRRMAVGLSGVGMLVFAGLRWLAGMDGYAGVSVLMVVRLLTLGMMLLVVGYLFELIGVFHDRIGKPADGEVGPVTGMEADS